MHKLAKIAAIAALSAYGMCAYGALPVTVNNLKVSNPVALFRPVITDSLNTKGSAYQTADLLDSRLREDIPASAAAVDTAGYITLPRPEKGLAAYVVETSLRPQYYTKGSVEVTSDAMFAISADGRTEKKTDVQADSLTPASTKTLSLTMKPEAEYKMRITVIADADAASDPRLRVRFTPDEGYDSIPVDFRTDGKRRFERRDLAIGTRVSGASISPDGRYMLLKYANTLTKDKTNSWATLTDLRTGRVIDTNINPAMQWMPRGSSLYHTVNAQSGFDIVVTQVPSMAQTTVMRGVPERGFAWSPAEDYIVYYTHIEGDKPARPLRRYESPDDRMPGFRDRSVPVMMYRETGQTRQLTFGKRQSRVADISADGRQMILTVDNYDPTEWPFYFSDIYRLDLATEALDTVATHKADIKSLTFSPDASRLFIVAGPQSFGDVGFNAGDHEIANAYDGQGYILDLASGDVKSVTRDFNPSIDGQVDWNRADGRIYFTAERGFENCVYAYDPARDTFTAIPQEIGYIQRYSVGGDEDTWMAYYGQSYDCSGRAYLYNMRKGTLQLVADPWKETADQIDWGRVERRVFTASDGTEIEGFVTYPPQYDPSKKYPMIVYYYGGTSPTKHNTYSQYNPQLYASRDYIVYQLNPSGTTGYGQEFSARHINTWGQRTADDIIEGTKSLCQELPSIDASRIGCIGASYGGFMTQYLLTLTDIFAAAVSHAGISNVTSYWGEGYWGYSYNAVAAAKSYPWNNPDLFTKHGSLFNADKIHTPLLLTHGEADTNVPIGESIQLYNALKILGRDVELITAEDEDHYISRYDNRSQWQDAVMAWFARWLQDRPQWWEDTAKKL